MGKTKKKKKSSSSETAPALVSDSTTSQASKSPRNVVVRSSNGSRFTTRSPRIRTVQNFALLWLTTSIDESDANFKQSLTQLQQIVNTIDVFTDAWPMCWFSHWNQRLKSLHDCGGCFRPTAHSRHSRDTTSLLDLYFLRWYRQAWGARGYQRSVILWSKMIWSDLKWF